MAGFVDRLRQMRSNTGAQRRTACGGTARVDVDLNIKQQAAVGWMPERQHIVKKAATNKTVNDQKFLSQKKQKGAAALPGYSPEDALKLIARVTEKNKDGYDS